MNEKRVWLQRLKRFRVEKKGHDADEGYAVFVGPRFFVGVASHDHLAEVVADMAKREGFLLALLVVGNVPGGLDVEALIKAVDDKVNLNGECQQDA